MWIAIVSMLSVYTIQKVKKIDGTEVPVDGGHTDDLIRFVAFCMTYFFHSCLFIVAQHLFNALSDHGPKRLRS